MAGAALFPLPGMARGFQTQPGEEVIPWLDRPAENPVPEVAANLLEWEQLDSWVTPTNDFFSVTHFGRQVVDENEWRLEVSILNVGKLAERKPSCP